MMIDSRDATEVGGARAVRRRRAVAAAARAAAENDARASGPAELDLACALLALPPTPNGPRGGSIGLDLARSATRARRPI